MIVLRGFLNRIKERDERQGDLPLSAFKNCAANQIDISEADVCYARVMLQLTRRVVNKCNNFGFPIERKCTVC